jgi:hypothetical protein
MNTQIAAMDAKTATGRCHPRTSANPYAKTTWTILSLLRDKGPSAYVHADYRKNGIKRFIAFKFAIDNSITAF